MKNLLNVILTLSFGLTAMGQNHPGSGVINKASAKNAMVNGLKEGLWIECTDGNFKITLDTSSYQFVCFNTYKAGKLSQKTKILKKDGQLFRIIPYKDGMKNGVVLCYGENHRLLWKKQYKNGKLNGSAKDYYGNGKLKSEETYLEDKIIKTKIYDESGHEIEQNRDE